MIFNDQTLPDLLASLPNRIGDVIDRSADRWPTCTSVIDPTGFWTYSQLSKAVENAADYLRSAGIRPRDRLMIVADNCRAAVAVFFAAAKIEAWPIVVNPRLSPPEIDAIRDHCGARALVYAPPSSVAVKAHAERHGTRSVDLPQLGPLSISQIDDAAVQTAEQDGGPDAVATIIYTSGSTGMPKGVMLTHRNLLFMAKAAGTIRSITPDDRLYGILPISHIVGLSVITLGTLMYGASLFLSPRFNPAEALASLAQDGVTILLGTPAMFAMLIEYSERKSIGTIDAPNLRIISSSGAPLDQAIKDRTERSFRLPLHNGYGITECAPTIAQTRPETPRSDNSVGLPLPGVEIKLAGIKEQAEEGVGELWVRGPNVMKGYYENPAATTAVLTDDGWFNTQDLARIEDGNLFIVGRSRDLIIRHGFNVYPAEVEAVLNSNPAIHRSAVLGRPENGTEEIVAFVELKPGSTFDRAALRDYAAARLAPYKLPSEVIVMDALPTTASGKIQKKDLLETLHASPA